MAGFFSRLRGASRQGTRQALPNNTALNPSSNSSASNRKSKLTRALGKAAVYGTIGAIGISAIHGDLAKVKRARAEAAKSELAVKEASARYAKTKAGHFTVSDVTLALNRYGRWQANPDFVNALTLRQREAICKGARSNTNFVGGVVRPLCSVLYNSQARANLIAIPSGNRGGLADYKLFSATMALAKLASNSSGEEFGRVCSNKLNFCAKNEAFWAKAQDAGNLPMDYGTGFGTQFAGEKLRELARDVREKNRVASEFWAGAAKDYPSFRGLISGTNGLSRKQFVQLLDESPPLPKELNPQSTSPKAVLDPYLPRLR